MTNDEVSRAIDTILRMKVPSLMRETNETIDTAELARRYDALLAARDALAAENARLREAVLDGIEAVTAVQIANGTVALRLIGWRTEARALVEAPR